MIQSNRFNHLLTCNIPWQVFSDSNKNANASYTATSHTHSPSLGGDTKSEPLTQREIELQGLLQQFRVQC